MRYTVGRPQRSPLKKDTSVLSAFPFWLPPFPPHAVPVSLTVDSNSTRCHLQPHLEYHPSRSYGQQNLQQFLPERPCESMAGGGPPLGRSPPRTCCPPADSRRSSYVQNRTPNTSFTVSFFLPGFPSPCKFTWSLEPRSSSPACEEAVLGISLFFSSLCCWLFSYSVEDWVPLPLRPFLRFFSFPSLC